MGGLTSRLTLEERRGGGGEGVWDPKNCVQKMARSDCKFSFFPTMVTLVCGGGSRGGGGSSYGCRPF